MNRPGRIFSDFDDASQNAALTAASADTSYFSDASADWPDEDQTEGNRSAGGIARGIALVCALCLWFGFVAWAALGTTDLSQFALITGAATAVLLPPVVMLLLWLALSNGNRDLAARLARSARTLDEESGRALSRLATLQEQLGTARRSWADLVNDALTRANIGTQALVDASSRIVDQRTRLDEAMRQSAATAEQIGELVAALEEATPRMDARLNNLLRSIQTHGLDLAERGTRIEEQFRATALLAEEARIELARTQDHVLDRLDLLQRSANSAGEELTSMVELASARIDLTIERTRAATAESARNMENQGAALDVLNDRGRDMLTRIGQESLQTFGDGMDRIDARVAQADNATLSYGMRARDLLKQLSEAVDETDRRLLALETGAQARKDSLLDIMTQLSSRGEELSAALARDDEAAGHYLERAEALILALDTGIREMDESMPAALERVEQRLQETRALADDTARNVRDLDNSADALTRRLASTADKMAEQRAATDQMLERCDAGLAGQDERIGAMRDAMQVSQDIAERLGGDHGQALLAALNDVRDAAEQAALAAGQAIRGVIPAAAAELRDASTAAMETAIREKVTDQMNHIAQIADNAVKAAHRATDHLMRQMMNLTDYAADLEARVTRAAQAEQGTNRTFMTERSSQIMAALKDNAIDIGKVLDQDIGEREWSNYLNGDKSLFARRAIKLLSGAEARHVQKLHRYDASFQENVSRYLADFEGMLGDVLSSANGHNIAIALLSSDLGKLYVALAQATNRLRVNVAALN